MPQAKGAERRKRGEIETLPSGNLRVKVYAGVDALSGRRIYLTDTTPPGPKAAADAEKARVRLANQVDEQRSPRTKATVNVLMDRYLELVDVEETTASPNPHECTERCSRHVCRPLANSTVRKVHYCLSGALARAIRWRWITVNPLDQAEPPRGVQGDPDPPTAEQAAVILNAAFTEIWWGVLLWLAMVTGARRGELCAMRWDRLDLERRTLTIRTAIAQHNTTTWERTPRPTSSAASRLTKARSAFFVPTARPV